MKVNKFRLLVSLSVILCLVFVSLTILVRSQNRAKDRLIEANELRLESVLLADQLRQSSDELTRMVRSYAATGNPIYEEYFWTVLAIREGETPRPTNYNKIFWDLVMGEEMEPYLEGGQAISLVRLMEQAGFTEDEFALLEQARERSDNLVELETIAMNAVKGRFRDAHGGFSVKGIPDRDLALQILMSAEYLAAKKSIMEPINQFLFAIEDRTNRAVAEAMEDLQFYQNILEILRLVFAVLLLLLLYRLYDYYRDSVTHLGAMAEFQKEKIREYEQIEKVKSDLITATAHEVRTPLTSIQGYTELLLAGPETPVDDRQNWLSHVQSQSVALGNIVSQLLDVARIESGQGLQLIKVNYDLVEAVQRVVGHKAITHPDWHVELRTSGPQCHVLADAGRIDQLLQHLLGNALKFSAPGSTIFIDVEELTGYGRVSVRDQGVGMTPADVQNIFKKFYRSDSIGTSLEGVGLGVAICKDVVSEHGGEIQVESEPGKGTRVSFTIPLAVTSA